MIKNSEFAENRWLVLLVVYGLGLTTILIILLFAEWPKNLPLDTEGLSKTRFSILAAISGALGGCTNMLSSLSTLIGSQGLLRSSILWFFLEPVGGLFLGILAYFFVQPLVTDVNSLNLKGILALSGLTGLFGCQFVTKLFKKFDILFNKMEGSNMVNTIDQQKVETSMLEEFITNGSKNWLEEHFKFVRKEIISYAKDLHETNKSSNRVSTENPIEPKYISDATMRYAPGVPFPDEPTFRERISASISGITIISAILVITFGFLGIFAMTRQTPNQATVTAFFDIVKIFAGAIVGSTGAAVVTSKIRKSK